ncbi:GATA zinc finger domain-containing protein 15-like [Toxorhynchites rutilus septentrionalis]|uniref:GATA zinc finger domain-containing protein 15-like n=1 Tax=Toxorhynchites rutilus septentrionalis TaxID=329112 RepID=UPI00247A5A5A|nr:GATA zinc finger domain-containing protein 15-like [Toxorhynchites rutilus septentrionalis]
MSNMKENIADYIKSTTMELNRDLSQMREEIQQLGNLSLEITANINQTPQDSQVEIEILEKLRTLSAVIISTGNNVEHMLPPPPESCPSLADELRAELTPPVNPPFYPPENSGWRILDSTRRWKADWSEYDARQLRRIEQQEEVDKARKWRKQNRRYNNNNNNRYNGSPNNGSRNRNNFNNRRNNN